MSDTDHISRNRGPVRALLIVLGLPQAAIGLWALLAPKSFFTDFGPGGGWVSALGPYDEHLVRDVGALFAGLGVLALVAAVRLRRSLVYAAVTVWLLFAVPHAVYHVLNLGPYTTADAIANVVTLAWTVAGPLIVLALLRAPTERVAPSPTGTGRIDGVPPHRAGPIVRYIYRETRKMTGKVVEPVAVTAHNPLMLMGYSALELALERSDRVPKRLKMLAELKASTMTGCEFCIDIGSKLSHDHGVSDRQLREFLFYRESDAFSPVEKLVIDYAAAMSRTPVEVSDETFAELREHFDEAQLVELTAAVATENYRGRFNGAFGLGSEGFADGVGAVEAEPAPA